ncbi:DNA polymerase III subunit gamma and tau [Spongisporangium articulatum]|uniref:DNA polymerase III subunit gamma/tau n=1 Tax=Spongisporangium articulatum TaxID=3362603 RepID=A0ABW8AKS2_9ACTN
MTTTALYRRYRPDSFAEVIGQEQVTEPLSVALTKNRVNHAYLFSGPRGCGKTTSARILARCLNCEQGPTPTPCGECPSCVELARGGPGSLDVVEIDAASHGGVDDARELRERAAFAPVRDRYKVFIIDEAHMVSPQGFNALLKIVEEPPEHIRFIFATTEPEKVIGTIRSRTHHYPFRLVPPERLGAYLAELCERESVPVGKGVLPLVVRAGGGSVRDSLSVLDQLMGGAGENGLDYATAVSLLGFTDTALLDDVVDALAAGDGAGVFTVIDRVIESGHDPRRFVEDLLERFRDLLVVAALAGRGGDAGHAVLRGVPDDQLQRMQSQAARYGASELSRAADVTNTALTDMTGATSPRLQLELLVARLLLPAVDDGQLGLGARLDRLERRLGSGAAPIAPAPMAPAPAAPAPMAPAPAAQPAAPAAPPAPTPAPAPTPEPEERVAPAAPSASKPTRSADPADDWAPAPQPVAATSAAPAPGGAADLEAVRRMWADILARLATIKRTTWSLVSQYAQVLDYDGQRLLLGFDSPGRVTTFGRGPHADVVRQALIDVIGLDCRVEASVSGGGGGAPSRPAPTPAPAAQSAPQSAPQPSPPASPARPESARPESARPESARPEPAPARAPQSRPADRPSSGPGRPGRPATPTPYDDIPPPVDEPVREDEVPPDDGWRAGGPPAGQAPRSTRPPQAQPQARSERGPQAAPRSVDVRTPPAPVVLPADDTPSKDDADLEGSHLVGAQVVQQLLGGKVIEEREG